MIFLFVFLAPQLVFLVDFVLAGNGTYPIPSPQQYATFYDMENQVGVKRFVAGHKQNKHTNKTHIHTHPCI